jgi:undecaprenyl pyrophosphate phosphatase UppP
MAIFWLFTLYVIVWAYILRLFEMPAQMLINEREDRDQGIAVFEGYFSYLYLVVVTITTVGYGDIIAHSVNGKLMLMLGAIWGAFLISLIVLIVANVFALQKCQKKAMQDIHVTQKAAKSISIGIKYFLAKKQHYMTLLKIKPHMYMNSEFLRGLRSKPLDKIDQGDINF